MKILYKLFIYQIHLQSTYFNICFCFFNSMPHFWEFGKSSPKHRNLQDGLFQIASQTCNLLVQVNNTNNISYGNNSSNIHINTLSHPGPSRTRTPAGPGCSRDRDREQLLVLIPPTIENSHKLYRPGLLGKPRLSVTQIL